MSATAAPAAQGRWVGDLLRHSAVYAAARVLLSALDLLMLPLYTRVLTPEAYGVVALGTALLAVFALVYPLGLDGAFGRFFFDHESGTARHRRAIGTIAVAIGTVGLAVAAAMSLFGPGPLASYLAGMSPRFFQLVVWTGFFNLFMPLWLQLLQVKREPRRYLGYCLLQAGLRAALTLVFVVVLVRGAEGWIEAYACSAVVTAGLAVTALLGELTPAVDRGVLRQAFAYALPLLAHQVAGWAIAYAGRLVLNQLGSLRDVGMFQVAFGIGAALGVVTTAVNFAYAPSFMALAARAPEAAAATFGAFATYYWAILATVGVLIALFAREITMVAAPATFAPAAPLIPIVTAAFVTQGVYYVLVNPVFFRKTLTAYLPIVTVVGGVFSTIACYLLIPKLGAAGAAWSSLLGNLVVVAAVYPLSRRALPMRYDARKALLAIATGAIVVAVSRLALPDAMPRATLIAADCALAALYVVALWRFDVIDRAAIRMLASTVVSR